MSGWFLMHRGWMQSPDFKPEPFTEPQAFIWSIEQAAHVPHLQWFNGAQYQVDRGEFVTSSRNMAAAFKWSEKRARGFQQRMSKCGKWTLRGAHQGTHAPTILSVCNYARFQSPAKAADAAKGAAKGAGGTHPGRTQDAQQKEGINNSNEWEAKKEASPPSRALVAILPFDDALEAWKQAAANKGWKPANPELTDKRRKGLGKILKVHGLDGFVAAIQQALNSELLGGPDPPGWFNFAFICSPENFQKLKDGNYDRQFSSNSSSAPGKGSLWLDACGDALAASR